MTGAFPDTARSKEKSMAFVKEREGIMKGPLSQTDLNDLLLLATGAKKSGLLRLSPGKETVELFLVEGEIIHATCPIGEGEMAHLYPVT